MRAKTVKGGIQRSAMCHERAARLASWWLAMSVTALVVLGSIRAAASELEFACPTETPRADCKGRNCCPPRYSLRGWSGDRRCVYDGRYAHYDEEPDARGRMRKVKQSEGRCEEGVAHGPVKQWVSREDGLRSVMRGRFEKGHIVGAVTTKNPEGLTTELACYGAAAKRGEILWRYALPEIAPRPSKPLRKRFDDKQTFASAMTDYKAATAERKRRLKQMEAGSRLLAKLARACPVPSDALCSRQPLQGSEIGGKSKRKSDETLQQGVVLSGQDPDSSLCMEGLALSRRVRTNKKNDHRLFITKVSLGVVGMRCVAGVDKEVLWELEQPLPQASDEEGRAASIAHFKKRSKWLKKHEKACEQPTEAFCSMMTRAESEGFDVSIKPRALTCLNGWAVTKKGIWTGRRGGLDRNHAGIRTLSTKWGVHEAQCVGIARATHRYRCGRNRRCSTTGDMPVSVWSFSHNGPPAAVPPFVPEPDSGDEERSTARADWKERVEVAKEKRFQLKRFSKLIKPFERLCNTLDTPKSFDDKLCGLLDDLETSRRSLPEGGSYGFHHERPCNNGYKVESYGRVLSWKFKDYSDGFHWVRIAPGYTEASCHLVEKEGREVVDSKQVWSVNNPYPGHPPPPCEDCLRPKRADHASDEAHEKAVTRHKEALAAHMRAKENYRRKLDEFDRRSKAIGKLGKTCPRMSSSYCEASGQCLNEGACFWDRRQGSCRPSRSSHCKRSLGCSKQALCVFEEGACVTSGGG